MVGSPFTPNPGSGQNLSVVSTVSVSSIAVIGQGNSLRLCNLGPGTVAFRMSDTTAVPAVYANDAIMASGGVEIFGCSATPIVTAISTGTSTATLNITRGDGV